MKGRHLKLEGDQETDANQMSIKHLQGVLFFCLAADYYELDGQRSEAYEIYEQALKITKSITEIMKTKNCNMHVLR